MLDPEPALVLYVLGVGYLAVLAWAAALHELINSTDSTPVRVRRFVVGSTILGVAHPAFALAALDVARQLRNETDADGGFAERAVSIATTTAALGVGVVTLVSIARAA